LIFSRTILIPQVATVSQEKIQEAADAAAAR
jgi:hypothetical protein